MQSVKGKETRRKSPNNMGIIFFKKGISIVVKKGKNKWINNTKQNHKPKQTNQSTETPKTNHKKTPKPPKKTQTKKRPKLSNMLAIKSCVNHSSILLTFLVKFFLYS